MLDPPAPVVLRFPLPLISACAPLSLLLPAISRDGESLEEQAICKGAARSANALAAKKLRKCAIDFTLPPSKHDACPARFAAIFASGSGNPVAVGTQWHNGRDSTDAAADPTRYRTII
jgi:hypothetical protein